MVAIIPRETLASLKPDKSRVYVVHLTNDGKQATIRTASTAITCDVAFVHVP